MFLRAHKRIKDGKERRYWSIVENRRARGDRVVQRQVLYLGEINDSQRGGPCQYNCLQSAYSPTLSHNQVDRTHINGSVKIAGELLHLLLRASSQFDPATVNAISN